MAGLANKRVWDGEVALGLRLSHMLATTDFEPRGMPPSATLLVRRLPDPLPRRLISDVNAIRSSPEWERAALSLLEDFYRSAVRPAREFVPAGAGSVLFLDEAEMLACLALDLVNGDAQARWWWTTVLRGLPRGAVEALLAAWRRKPQCIPAALHYLAQRREAVKVVGAISPSQAWGLLIDVARVFQLHVPTSAPVFESVPVPVHKNSPSQPREQHPRAEPQTFDPGRDIVQPWVPLIAVDAVPESLGRERAALLGVSLLLQRAPQIPRGAAFARGFAQWYEAAARAQEKPDSPAEQCVPSCVGIQEKSSVQSPAAGETAASSQLLGDTDATESREFPRKTGVATEVPRRPEPGAPLSATEILATATKQTERVLESSRAHNLVEHPPTPVADVSLSRESTQTTDTERATLVPAVANEPSSVDQERQQSTQAIATKEAQTAAESMAAHSAQDQIETELGGVFFLINLVRGLGLHRFLEELGLDEQLKDWALVELLARCLIGPRNPLLVADPIWRALATLDGRDPAIEAGHNFRGCERYALPRAWTSFLAGSENRGLGLRLRDSHLQIWHEQGFLLLDALFAGEVTQNIIQRQLSECREDYVLMDRAALRKVLSGTGFAGCGPLSVTPAREFHRFLAFLMPYIRWRLASNLGLNSARSSVIRDVLLLRSAHLYVTATHIDLVMSMNQASGPVRLAGLDADPGWLPSFGRVVKFHFI